MAELVALYIICRNIGRIARQRGLRPGRYQFTAVALWIAFELIAGFVLIRMGFAGAPLYVLALAAAVFSVPVAFRIVRNARVQLSPANATAAPATVDDPAQVR